jgi:hypothetical protein
MPSEQWQIFINDNKLHKNLKVELYNHMSKQTVIPYWQKKGRFLPEGSQDINWNAVGEAMKQSTHPRRQWIT